MYRIRFHGRGGQGMKTSSRILGTAFFIEGYEVQDAPRYGAERRGAPISAYVRADRDNIHERGVIQIPDLVIVADDTLVPIPPAGVLKGISRKTILLINSSEKSETWHNRLNISNSIITLPVYGDKDASSQMPFVSSVCAGAAAKLTGAISLKSLEQAVGEEFSKLNKDMFEKNLEKAIDAYKLIAEQTDTVITEGVPISAKDYKDPEFIRLPFEDARTSAPVIHAGLTSVEVKTGLWRTMRPVIDYEHCRHCWWLCCSFCPDAAISAIEGVPQIDYDHCKGCMICLAQCPPHAIEAVPESKAQEQAS